MVPVIIISVAVYGLFAKFGLIGTIPGLVVGHTMLCVPFVILVITANLQRFDVSLEMAARNLGANAIKTFLLITIPIIKPGIIAAGVFCFIISLDELVLTMFLIGTKRLTLPIKMFSQIQFRLDPVVAAASTVFILAAIGITVFSTFLRQEKKSVIKEKEDEFLKK
jgi:ABC-type spermidine/putrescine transport system permease subunit II